MVSQWRLCCKSHLLNCVGGINTEPVILLFSIQLGIFGASFPPFLFYKICANFYGVDMNDDDISTFCKDITEPENATQLQIKENVEIGVSSFSRYIFLCGSAPMLIVCLMMGSFMDAHGRKGPLVFALITNVISNVMMLIFCIKIRTSYLWILAPFLLGGITGQTTVPMVACFTAITDSWRHTTHLTTRLGIGASMSTVGIVIGSLLEGWVIKAYGFNSVMIILNISIVIPSLYAIIFVRETVHLTRRSSVSDVNEDNDEYIDQSDAATTVTESASSVYITGPKDMVPAPPPPLWFHRGRNFLRQSFTVHRFLDTLKTVVKKRPNYNRCYLIILLVGYFILAMAEIGPPFFLYLKRAPLYWTASLYGYYIAYASALGAIGSGLTAWLFSKVFRMSDMSLLLIGLLFSIIQKVIFMCAEATWTIFFAGFAILIAAVANPGSRAAITMLVEKRETGKIFSVCGLMDNIAPLVSAIVYNTLYNATLRTAPRAAFIVSTCIVLLGMLLVMGIYVHSKCTRNREVFNEEKEAIVSQNYGQYGTNDGLERHETSIERYRNG